MVMKRILAILLLLTATLSCAQAASKKLDVSVDRKQLHEDETLQLRVVGDVKLNLSFNNLWNLNSLQLPKPDLGNLTQDFDIVNRRQSYNIKSINGNTTARVTWTYVLAPRRTGQLAIPAIHYKNAGSSPIPITVLAGSGGNAMASGATSSVKVTLDHNSVYVQQQLILTEELTYQGPLLKGKLDQLSLDNAVVQALGKADKYTRTENGRTLHILKRRYAVFPQNTGTLKIPAQGFSGEGQDPMTGNIRYLHAASKPRTVTVKAAPASFKGKTWLPATSLLVTDKFSQPLDSIHVGDSITRTIKIQALGQLDSSLPPLRVQYPASLKNYPDQPRLKSGENNGTLDSSRTESVALVPTSSGQVTLPAIRIPWWDTVNNVERYAQIPARTIQVLPAGSQSGTTSAPMAGGKASAARTAAPSENNAANNGTRPAGAPTPKPRSVLHSVWFWVVVALLAAWLLTLALWWRERRQRRPGVAAPSQDADNTSRPDGKLYPELRQAIITGQARALTLLPRWAQQHFRNSALQSAADVANFFNDREFSTQLDALERHLYADPEHRGIWEGEKLASRLDTLSRRHPGSAEIGEELPPLYPFTEPGDQSKS